MTVGPAVKRPLNDVPTYSILTVFERLWLYLVLNGALQGRAFRTDSDSISSADQCCACGLPVRHAALLRASLQTAVVALAGLGGRHVLEADLLPEQHSAC